MGSSRWDSAAWASYSSATTSKSRDEIFKSTRSMSSDLDPKDVKVRESRDSVANPNSTALIVGVDVTGSMGMIAEAIAREGLGILFNEMLSRKHISDPHLMFMAIGDANYDRAPLQVSQFEADNRIVDQLTSIYIEGGGGGNNFESYNLPWYFAANHTSIDCFEKRGKKGYLFTVGDESTPAPLTRDQIKKICGDDIQTDELTNDELLMKATQMYHVFHVIVEEGSHAKYNLRSVQSKWRDLLGQNVIGLSDYRKLSEVIVSTIQVIEGANADDVVKSWSKDTSLVVANAIHGLVPSKTVDTGSVVRL